jgi:hypothetical protein
MSSPSPTDPQPKSKAEIELDLLKQEYFFLQTTIEDYNKQIWVIKALGITGTGAVIGLVLQQKQEQSLYCSNWLCNSHIFLGSRESMETLSARLLSPCG